MPAVEELITTEEALREPGSWPAPDALAPFAVALRDHAARTGTDVDLDDAEAQIVESLTPRMW